MRFTRSRDPSTPRRAAYFGMNSAGAPLRMTELGGVSFGHSDADFRPLTTLFHSDHQIIPACKPPSSARMPLMDSVTAGEQALSTTSAREATPRRLAFAGLAYLVLLAIFWLIARYFRLQALEQHPFSTFTSFALLFAPYWFFGFGAAGWVRHALPAPGTRIAAAA